MRLRTLELERYGPFTGRTLNFRSDANLHVVYGANEAGKSCALAAVTDLFFGIERQTRYDFLHEGKELRIGATIVGRNGSSLAFRRRKGNKNTLIDAAEVSLSDDTLLPYLGGLTREVFCNAFGLDLEALRRGAEEMLKSDGDVGTSLFAAASGMRGLADLSRRLEDEAGAVFAPRASKDRKFYQALGRYEDARKAIHDRELRAGDWTALIERIENLSKRMGEIKTLRGVKAAERSRLSRSKRVAPLIQLIDRARASLVALGPIPDVPTGFSKELQERLERARKARETRTRLAEDEAAAARKYAEIVVDEGPLKRAGDVLRLFGETGAYTNSQRDLPRIQVETNEYRQLMAEFAVRLGLNNESEVEAALPTDAAQALVRTLIAEGRGVTDMLAQNTVALDTERTALAEIERQQARRGNLINPQPLRARFATLTPLLATVQSRAETENAIRAETRNLREAACRLNPPVSDLDALAGTALPSLETITRFRGEQDALALEVQRERDRLAAATEAVEAAKSKLQELTSGRPVPIANAIDAKRQQRDSEWMTLRAALLGPSEGVTKGQLAEVVTNFERYSSEADQMADNAANDAKRVAAYTAETRRLSEEQRKKIEAESRTAALDRRQQELSRSWTVLWGPAGIAPLHPSEMGGWLSSIGGLIVRREKLQLLNDALAAIVAAVRNIEPALRTLAREVELNECEVIDLVLLAAQIEDRLQVISERWDQARDLDSRMRDGQRRIEGLIAAEVEVRQRVKGWSERWISALLALRMAEATTIEEAEAALHIWNKVPSTIRELNNRARRVGGMLRDTESFERDTKILLKEIAPDLLALPAAAAVKVLNERLTEARAVETRRTEYQRRLVEIVRAREQVDEALAKADDALAALAALYCPEDNLSDLLRRVTERDNLLDAIKDRQTQFVVQADGHEEDEVRAELADFNSDEVESVLRIIAEEEQDLERQAQELFAAHSQAMREREVVEQGVGAEVAAQQRSSAEAELITTAHEWLVLELAALLIKTAIDRYRARQHDPLMTRASILFATLTGGSFAGIGQDFDEHDMPLLVGRRPTGETVHVSGMSTGARDQLYLALRLAYLEDYATRSEPAPFIGDDLFATFDEDRTASSLAALAAIGDRVQPIVFTHHQHVAAIARTRVNADVIVL